MSPSTQVEPDDRLNRSQQRAASGKRQRHHHYRGPTLAEHERRERQRAQLAQSESIRPRFVSIREACRYLNCSRSHFYVAFLPRVKTTSIGKRRVIDFASLEKLGDELLGEG
jgi:hypothetical protein